MLQRIFLLTLLACLVLALAQLAKSQPAPPPPPGQNPGDMEPAASRWPLHVAGPEGDIIVFQPQLDDFQGNQITSRAAVEVPTSDPDKPLYGVIWLQSRVNIDRSRATR